MSRLRKLSHTVWHCHYHIVWTPKYRLKILEGAVATEVANCIIKMFSEQKACEVVELKPYWGNHFWARGYCVDTVGLDEDKIRRYVKYQEA
ncbi:MAG: transposase [Desulfobulbaceae bacterium]|nr:transposase [Desulfobulbaceae bacterium]